MTAVAMPMRFAQPWRRVSPMTAAILMAIAVHVVILAIHFSHERHRPPPPLEITLNAPRADKTMDASLHPSSKVGKVAATQALSSQAGINSPTSTTPRPGQGPLSTGRTGRTDSNRKQPSPSTFDQLNAAVRRSLRTGYITSRDKDGPAGRYLAHWKHQVENYGNAHYPDALVAHNLSGQLVLEVTVDQAGHVLNIAIRQSSGNRQIDEAARRIVQLAAPYPPFPPELARKYHQLVITRTWQFSSGNRLQTHR